MVLTKRSAASGDKICREVARYSTCFHHYTEHGFFCVNMCNLHSTETANWTVKHKLCTSAQSTYPSLIRATINECGSFRDTHPSRAYLGGRGIKIHKITFQILCFAPCFRHFKYGGCSRTKISSLILTP